MHTVSAVTPAELAERQHDAGPLYDAADRLTEARENVKSSLLRGKKVGRFTLDAAFEVSVGEEMKWREILGILADLVTADGPIALREAQERAEKLVDALINESMSDEVEEERERILAEDVAGNFRRCGAL